MKKLFTPLCIFLAFSVSAQLKLPGLKANSSIKTDIEKVASDYFKNFDNIKGDTLMNGYGTIEFYSKVVPAGALDATITHYISSKTYSWQSTLFKAEEFKEAASRYKQYFRQLNGATFTFTDKNSYRLSGIYDTPDEGRTFASSLLEVSSYDRNLKHFKVELALNYVLHEWVIRVMIYEKVADEDIRPSVNPIPRRGVGG